MLSKSRITGPVLALIVSAPALADAPAPTAMEAAIAARLVDAACFDVAPGGAACDRVLLLTSETLEGMVDLLIVPSNEAMAPLVARDFALHRDLDGQRARLANGENGSFLVHSQQSSHGRYPWFETLEIAYHDDAFQVVGYMYSTYDRPMGGDFSCDVDLVAGTWRAVGVRVDPESMEDTIDWDTVGQDFPDETDVRWWSFREPPPHCDEILASWFDHAP
ncbi:hypothetical protein [Gymnodinialimonas hymeniacidonis]|uniref:hypothetical protein n=1 Tax=Gymnodinialimonas hymeniacidonis TaxID=3126508 RepID=UPI0034C6C702